MGHHLIGKILATHGVAGPFAKAHGGRVVQAPFGRYLLAHFGAHAQHFGLDQRSYRVHRRSRYQRKRARRYQRHQQHKAAQAHPGKTRPTVAVRRVVGVFVYMAVAASGIGRGFVCMAAVVVAILLAVAVAVLRVVCITIAGGMVLHVGRRMATAGGAFFWRRCLHVYFQS